MSRVKIFVRKTKDGHEFVRVEPPEMSKFVTVAGNRFIAARDGVRDLFSVNKNGESVDYEVVVTDEQPEPEKRGPGRPPRKENT
jgi:hypothetical protein